MVAWKGSIVTATIANVNMVTDKMAMEKDAKDIDNFLKRCFVLSFIHYFFESKLNFTKSISLCKLMT